MFKAKLIESKQYYGLKSKHWYFILLPALPISILMDLTGFSTWGIILVGGIYVLGCFYLIRHQRKLNEFLGIRTLELNQNEIRISSNGSGEVEVIKVLDIDQIVINNYYGVGQDNLKEIANEMRGHPKQNYLVICQNNEKQRLDFEIDSSYMVNQIEKVIDAWDKMGVRILRE